MAELVARDLTDRRRLLRPEDVGLRCYPGRRRVAGLRREEVAELAAISAEYYVRLEQGRGHHPSPQVLHALGRALRLDEDALWHLRRLAMLDAGEPLPDLVPSAAGDGSLAQLVDDLGPVPALVLDRNQDVVTANALARRLCGPALAPGTNVAVEVFAQRVPTRQWEERARTVVAALRFHADPRSRRLAELVETLGELGGEAFRSMWARHEARRLGPGQVVVPSPSHGELLLRRQALDVPGRTGTTLLVLTAPPGTVEARTLARLVDEVAERPGGADAELPLAS